MKTARAVAADVVKRVLDDGAWAQPTLDKALWESGMDMRDKAFATELTYGTLRWAMPLEQSLLRGADKPSRGLDERMRPHLLVAAYQLQHLSERVPAHAAVSEAVNAVRRVRKGLDGFANALLRKLGSPLHTLLAPTATIDERADALGIPHTLAHAVAAAVPTDDVAPALLALNGRPTTYAYALGEVPAQASLHAFVPRVFALDGGMVIGADGFKEGAFVVMDPGSVVAAQLVGAQAGARVIDLCAAPGGKSVALAHALGDTGCVVAVELSAKRAERIAENANRTGLKNRIELVVGDALTLAIEPADAVLLDAPCTGFGTTRRKPEIKLRRTPDDVARNAEIQATLFRRAAELVRPGGVLVYSVCSPIDAEGADQVARFLEAHADFAIEDARGIAPWLPADAVDARGFVRLFPHRHDADAFFCARIRRKSVS